MALHALVLNVNTPLNIIYEQLSEINKVLQELMKQFLTALYHVCTYASPSIRNRNHKTQRLYL
jgi:hypothetical protein